MSADPSFAATAIVGTVLSSATADTSLTAPAAGAVTAMTWSAAIGASGAKIDEIVIEGVGTTIAGVLNIFLHDGTTLYLYDQVLITAITPSATAASFRQVNRYSLLVVPNGWTIKIATENQTTANLRLTASGGNF